ncbi:MAG: DUF2156 domain-containing protein [Clostridia bacterium]|nr:DUF2156 domain-containing protein [Clostridia bacterium]
MIPEFQPLTAAHLPKILAYIRDASGRLCDRTSGILYMWANQYNTELAEHDGRILLRSRWDGRMVYGFPWGQGALDSALNACRADAEAKGSPLTFASLTEEEAALICDHFGHACTRESNDGWSDYLYDAPALAALTGRAYHGPRNHINRFLAEYPDYSYCALTADQMDAVAAFYREHRARTADNAVPSALAEAETASNLISLFPTLVNGGAPLCGGVLRVREEIVGFSIGERLGDTLFVHIEKGNTAYSGVYPMLVREFARLGMTPNIFYINREEDDGHPGLRRSKQAYHPVTLLRKFIVSCP